MQNYLNFHQRDVEELYEALSSNSNVDRSQWEKWNDSYLVFFMETLESDDKWFFNFYSDTCIFFKKSFT